jgi:hypothetical protein
MAMGEAAGADVALASGVAGDVVDGDVVAGLGTGSGPAARRQPASPRIMTMTAMNDTARGALMSMGSSKIRARVRCPTAPWRLFGVRPLDARVSPVHDRPVVIGITIGASKANDRWNANT